MTGVNNGDSETVDPRGAAPVYRQLAAILRRRITSGQIPPGRVLPSETQLQQEFGISRNTVRRSIALLREQGLAVTVAGRGTYVASPLPGPEDGEDA